MNLHTILILQYAVSMVYFTNKVFLICDMKFGWLVGTLAAVLGVIYFYLLGLPVYTTLNAGLVILMSYGYFKGEKKNPQVEMLLRISITLTMLALTFFAFKGMVTLAEFFSSIGLLFGTYYLTHSRAIIGWFLFFVGHSLGVYIGQKTNQNFFADSQIASSIVAIVAIIKIQKSRNSQNST